MVARIVNSLTEAFNRNDSLPTYIVMMPDKDILKHINHFDYGVSWIISKYVHWICTQMNRMITTRRNKIIDQRPGALLTNDQPTVIWIGMLERPRAAYDTRNLEKVLALHWKFNDLMATTITQAGHKFIEISEVFSFDFSANLTTTSKVKFWRNFDDKFKQLHYSIVCNHNNNNHNVRTSRGPPHVHKNVAIH